MKIAVSANQPNLEGDLDPRFGRCNYFIIIDPDTLEFTAMENPYMKAMGGVGPDTAHFIVQKGVQAVITGSIGAKAHRSLSTAGVDTTRKGAPSIPTPGIISSGDKYLWSTQALQAIISAPFPIR